MKTIISVLIFVFISTTIFSQNLFPVIGKIYNDKLVPRIDITILPEDLDALYNDVYSNIEYHAVFQFSDGTISETMNNVGFRLRGNTSRVSAKKSFKITFNAFDNQQFHEMDNMNLNGEHNDPSIIRSKLCWNLLRKFKVLGSRANHVQLFINNQYYGLYMNIESIDDKYLKKRYGTSEGNLYKCLYPANLQYIGTNPNSYKFEQNGHRVYELKTNETEDDYTDLANFINILNNTSVNQFPEFLEPVFNVNLYLKALAVEVLTAHWDNYSFNQSNYYLYHNPKTGKFDYIDYDMDNTFGIDWFNIDWAKRNIYNWSSSDQRPLTKRLLQNTEYKAIFSFYVNLLLDNYFRTDSLNQEIDEIKQMITSYAEDDIFRTLDYGYSIADFNNSYTTALGEHVKYGLKPYISTRYTSAKQQLSITPISPVVSIVNFSDFTYYNPFTAEVIVEDDGIITGSKFFYKLDNGEWHEILMNDNGELTDSVANDDVFTVSVDTDINPLNIEFYFEFTDDSQNITREPYSGNYSAIREFVDFPDLYINEMMVSNSITIADEFGEYEDWVEIYNAENTEISTLNLYLTDDIANPGKWKFPELNIPAKGFMLIWCDTTVEQGIYHTGFKLAKEGEQLGLFLKNKGEYVGLDKFTYLHMESDISFGRKKDGENPFVFFTIPTPYNSNNQSIEYEQIFTVYPNPCKDYFNIWTTDFTINQVKISDITGRTFNVDFDESENKIYMTKMPVGIYVLNIFGNNTAGQQVCLKAKIIKEY